MKNIQKISNLELSELSCLIGEVNSLLRAYLHVTDHLPKSLVKSISDFQTKIHVEQDKREDSF